MMEEMNSERLYNEIGNALARGETCRDSGLAFLDLVRCSFDEINRFGRSALLEVLCQKNNIHWVETAPDAPEPCEVDHRRFFDLYSLIYGLTALAFKQDGAIFDHCYRSKRMFFRDNSWKELCSKPIPFLSKEEKERAHLREETDRAYRNLGLLRSYIEKLPLQKAEEPAEVAADVTEKADAEQGLTERLLIEEKRILEWLAQVQLTVQSLKRDFPAVVDAQREAIRQVAILCSVGNREGAFQEFVKREDAILEELRRRINGAESELIRMRDGLPYLYKKESIRQFVYNYERIRDAVLDHRRLYEASLKKGDVKELAENYQKLVELVDATAEDFEQSMHTLGARAFDEANVPFDPKYHELAEGRPRRGATVTQVLRKGFKVEAGNDTIVLQKAIVKIDDEGGTI